MRSMLCILHLFHTHAATTESYTLSLHDALPICNGQCQPFCGETTANCPQDCKPTCICGDGTCDPSPQMQVGRSEEHTSELQSLRHLVCRLLLEKKKKNSKK